MSAADLRHDPSTNNPPEAIPPSAPAPATVEADLKTRYAAIGARLTELETSAATIPAKIGDDDTAGKVQAWLKLARVSRTGWDATRKSENEEWKSIVGAVNNFFKRPIEKLEGLEKAIRERLTTYLEAKEEAERIVREEKLRVEREEAARQQRIADDARAAAEKAMDDERRAREREQALLEDQLWAEARRELALYDARKAEEAEAAALERQREREAQEKKDRAEDKRRMTALSREAKGLGKKDADGTITEDEAARYRALIGDNGEIAMLNKRLTGADEILTDDQRAERVAEAAELARLRHERATNEARAVAERLKAEEAKRGARGARVEQREARTDQREAQQEERIASAGAERHEKKSDRLEAAIDAPSAPIRGEMGTTGGLAGRWTVISVDHARVALEPLRAYLNPEALDAAAHKYMMANIADGDPKLEGAVFDYVRDARVS